MSGGGGGGGQPTQSTVTQTNIPEYARPYVESMLGATMSQLFETEKIPGKAATPAVVDDEGRVIKEAVEATPERLEITKTRPYKPYSERAEDYFAVFSPEQQAAFREAAALTRPGGFGQAGIMASQAGQGGLDTTSAAMGYGGQGAQVGRQAVALGRDALGFGQAGADIGIRGTTAAEQGFGAGAEYARMATDPRSIQSYMSPYMQNVVDVQKQQAIRDYQEQVAPQQQAQAVRAGAFGGSRDAVQRAIGKRSLASQLQNIQATGSQKAFEDAQRAQQFGITSGLQGIQTGLQGLGQAGQLQELGMRGTQLGMQGAQVGLQGIQGAQAGYGMAGQMGRSLADIGATQQASDISRMDFQSRLGSLQQGREQQLMDQAIKNYQMAREYPYEQLSRYSGLLRGYYTPTTTASTYQASNPMAQAVGTFAQGYGTYKGLTGKEGGQVKAYAKGGILDAKVFNDPTAFSPEMIQKGMQNDTISDMIGAIGLSQIAEARKQFQQSQALSKPAQPGTVLSDLQQQAMASQGIEAAPTQLPATLAGGGIIAFAGEDGSLVEEETAEPSSIADFIKLAKKEFKVPKTKEETEYEESLRKRPEELKKQQLQNRYLALAKFGGELSKAASKTKSFTGALGEATTATLPSLTAGEKAYYEGVAGAGKELAGLGAKARAEEIEGAKAGIDMYGRAKQREASKSNLKEYAENYVAEKIAAGDKRDPKAIWNEGATKYAMITAAPRYTSAEASQLGAVGGISDKINKLRESVRNDIAIANMEIKPNMSATMKATINAAKERVAAVNAEIAALQGALPSGARPSGTAPAAGNQLTIGGKTYTRPPGMTDKQWEDYKRYAAGVR